MSDFEVPRARYNREYPYQYIRKYGFNDAMTPDFGLMLDNFGPDEGIWHFWHKQATTEGTIDTIYYGFRTEKDFFMARFILPSTFCIKS